MHHRRYLRHLPEVFLHCLAADLVGSRRAVPLLQRSAWTLERAAVAVEDAAEPVVRELLPWAWRRLVLLVGLAVLIGVMIARKGR